MTHQQYDVASLGNAIVDIIASVDDRFLLTHRIAKGSMTLIDEFRAKELLKALADNQQTMSSLHEVAGGSAANTMAGLASLGGNGLFLGKVSDDRLGKVFGDSMAATGVTFHNGSSKASASTASSMIAVTPDGQRSMNTYLGACREMVADDVDEGTGRLGAHPLYRRLSVGRGKRQAGLAQGHRGGEGRGRAHRAHPVGPVLRRPLPRRIPASAGQGCEHPVRQ